MAIKMRYLVQIQFVGQYGVIKIWDIAEEVKTLKEAQTYKSIIDQTVNKARVVDLITNKIVETWK